MSLDTTALARSTVTDSAVPVRFTVNGVEHALDPRTTALVALGRADQVAGAREARLKQLSEDQRALVASPSAAAERGALEAQGNAGGHASGPPSGPSSYASGSDA